jgi:hypothetical protein
MRETPSTGANSVVQERIPDGLQNKDERSPSTMKAKALTVLLAGTVVLSVAGREPALTTVLLQEQP